MENFCLDFMGCIMDSLRYYVPYITALNSVSLIGIVIVALKKYQTYREELESLHNLEVQNTKRIASMALALRQQQDSIQSLQQAVRSLRRQ